MARKWITLADRLAWLMAGYGAGVILSQRSPPQPRGPLQWARSFTLWYQVRDHPDYLRLPEEFRIGGMHASSYMDKDQCELDVDPNGDPTGTAPPTSVISGNPGQQGFNVTLRTTNPVNLATGQPGHCTADHRVTELVASFGSSSRAFSIGQWIDFTGVNIRLASGREYLGSVQGSNAWFRGRILSIQNAIVDGSFSFVIQEKQAGPTVIFGYCSFKV